MPVQKPVASIDHSRNIPSLDGLRAVAVSAVILSHSDGWALAAKPGLLRYTLLALGQGGLGVQSFFIISGFLITGLLLKEIDRDGDVSLKRFYIRRSLRIFPPYYVYLIAASIIAALASRPIPRSALVTSLTYTSNYWPYTWIHPFFWSWYTAHTWSLSVEEQFYLLWPFLLAKLPQRRSIRVCVLVVFVTPLLRLLTVLYCPVYAMAEQWFRLFQTDVDSLAIGCLMAFALRQTVWRERLERYLHPVPALCAVAYLISCARILTHEPPWVSGLFTITFANVCLAYLIAYVVLRPYTPLGVALNWKPLRHVGVLSYSLYLWQQVFLGPYRVFSSWLASCAAIFVCAELSFWLVERPSLRLRERLKTRL